MLEYQIEIHDFLHDYFDTRIAAKISDIEIKTGKSIDALKSFDKFNTNSMQYPRGFIYDLDGDSDFKTISEEEDIYNYRIKFYDEGGDELRVIYNLMAYKDAIKKIIRDSFTMGDNLLMVENVKNSPAMIFERDASNYLGFIIIEFKFTLC